MAGEERIAVVIPTLNEAASIAGVIAEVIADLPRETRVIIADGGSTDATVARAQAAGAEVIAPGRGYGRACLAGAAAAAEADIIVFMDGDGADDPRSLLPLVAPIRAGACDFVLASRALGVREPGSIGWHQRAAGWLAGLGTAALYGVRYTDMCAFRAIRRDALFALGMREMTYGWNIEMQMRAARAGLRIREIPVAYRRRTGGESKVAGSVRGTVRASVRIVATFFRVAFHPPLKGEGVGGLRPPFFRTPMRSIGYGALSAAKGATGWGGGAAHTPPRLASLADPPLAGEGKPAQERKA